MIFVIKKGASAPLKLQFLRFLLVNSNPPTRFHCYQSPAFYYYFLNILPVLPFTFENPFQRLPKINEHKMIYPVRFRS